MTFDRVHTRSVAFERVLRKARGFARDGVDAVILGESGTGKLTLCYAIHAESSRRSGPFVVVEVGHGEKQIEIAIRASAGGTLVVREPILLAHTLQDKFGKAREVRLLVTSTRKFTEVDMQQSTLDRLRAGLRAHVLVLTPLRARLVDLPLLVDEFAGARARALHRKYQGHADDLIAALAARTWTRNLAELRKVVEDATLFAQGPVLVAADLERTSAAVPLAGEGEIVPLEQIKRAAILRALALCGGNQSQAAKKLQIARTTLLKFLQAPK